MHNISWSTIALNTIFHDDFSHPTCQGCQIIPKSATEMVLATIPNRINVKSPRLFWSFGTTKSNENEAEMPTNNSSQAR